MELFFVPSRHCIVGDCLQSWGSLENFKFLAGVFQALELWEKLNAFEPSSKKIHKKCKYTYTKGVYQSSIYPIYLSIHFHLQSIYFFMFIYSW